MNFLPGPWKVSKGRTVGHERYQIHAEGRQVALVWNSNKNAEANARLIAASPDLFIVCQRLVNAHQSGWGDAYRDEITAAALAAVRAATGETA